MTRWLLLICLLAGSAALAASDSEKEAATRFQRGVSLFKDGDFEAALTEFKQAYRIAPFYEVLYNIGLTQRRLFQYGEAVKSLNDYLEQGGKKVSAQRREAVRKELEEIRQLTCEVTLQITGEGEAVVSVDGIEVGKTPLKEPLLLRPGKRTIVVKRGDEIATETPSLLTASKVTIKMEPRRAEGKLVIESDPPGAIIAVDGNIIGEAPALANVGVGAHTINADKDGYDQAAMEVTLTEGQSRRVTIKLVAAREDSGGGGGPRGSISIPGIVVAGAGAAMIGVAVAFNASAGGAAKQLSALYATGGTYDKAAQQIEATGQTSSALSWLFGVTGGAAFATGAIIFLVSLFSEPAESSDVSFFFTPTQNGVAAGWSLKW
ncbi:MAG: PEGA domain-containing protein [Archangium sp.]|nr:PEGA domain-containing protein [Archangium sp.]